MEGIDLGRNGLKVLEWILSERNMEDNGIRRNSKKQGDPSKKNKRHVSLEQLAQHMKNGGRKLQQMEKINKISSSSKTSIGNRWT